MWLLRVGLVVGGLFLCFGMWNCDPAESGEVVSEVTQADGGMGEQKQDSVMVDKRVGSEPTTAPDAKDEPPVRPEPPIRPEPPVIPDRPTQPDAPVVPEPLPEPMVKETTPDKAGDDVSQAGPLQVKTLAAMSHTMPSSTGCSGGLCKVSILVSMPSGQGSGGRVFPYPLAIVSNGFLTKASFYKSYAERLASWGYVVLRWDTNGENFLNALKHDVLGKMVVELINWADAENKKPQGSLSGLVSVGKVFVVGHSRGGKASALAAQADARIAGFFGIDPVDSNPPGQSGVSAVAQMAKVKAAVAVVGADKGASGLQACAPANDNYEKFYNASPGVAWELLLNETGHMQFLDTQTGCLSCLACTKGSTADAVVRAITQTAMVAWAEKSIRGMNVDRWIKGSWVQDLVNKGQLKTRTKP